MHCPSYQSRQSPLVSFKSFDGCREARSPKKRNLLGACRNGGQAYLCLAGSASFACSYSTSVAAPAHFNGSRLLPSGARVHDQTVANDAPFRVILSLCKLTSMPPGTGGFSRDRKGNRGRHTASELSRLIARPTFRDVPSGEVSSDRCYAEPFHS
jgi:hypothetical protein